MLPEAPHSSLPGKPVVSMRLLELAKHGVQATVFAELRGVRLDQIIESLEVSGQSIATTHANASVSQHIHKFKHTWPARLTRTSHTPDNDRKQANIS